MRQPLARKQGECADMFRQPMATGSPLNGAPSADVKADADYFRTGASGVRSWNRVVLASGHCRGGTTWLGRLLSLARDSGYIFEPLTHTRHPQTAFGPLLREFNLTTKHWLFSWPPSTEKESRHVSVVGQQVQALCDLYFPTPVDTLIIKQPGVEHLLLMQGVLQPEVTIYIKRHPLAILNSYCQSDLYVGWNLGRRFELCRGDVADLRPDLTYLLSEAGNDRELKVLAMICLAHRLAQDWAAAGRLRIIDYKELALGGPAAVIRLFELVGLRMNEEKADELGRLFTPKNPKKGFLDTEKQSARRVSAYISELAPWQLSKAKRYLEQIGYDVPIPAQSGRAQLTGVIRYCQRNCWRIKNSAVSHLSLARKRVFQRPFAHT
jgi:hypothetical protein